MWSTSGAFTKVLTKETPLGLHEPRVDELLIAFYRALFAGLALVPFLRIADIRIRKAMVPMAACFALMNWAFVAAMALGTAANAIFLQYTAPMWMYLAGVWWLGEKGDLRALTSILVGLAGIAVIVAGGWQEAQLNVIALGIGSGFAYAGVVIFLRTLRDASSRWLTVVNHLTAALVLLPWIVTKRPPTAPQLVLLFIYGALQMAVPYWLMARGLRSVGPGEAGTITLMEPVLNPVWAYLISGEEPKGYTLIGGAFIVGALAYRYWPAIRDARSKA